MKTSPAAYEVKLYPKRFAKPPDQGGEKKQHLDLLEIS